MPIGDLMKTFFAQLSLVQFGVDFSTLGKHSFLSQDSLEGKALFWEDLAASFMIVFSFCEGQGCKSSQTKHLDHGFLQVTSGLGFSFCA